MTKAYYPLLGTWGDSGPDHMAEQMREMEPPSVVERDGVAWDPATHWRTKEGDLVLISTMSDSHLRNSLRMLWRAADRWSWSEVLNSPLVNEDEHAVEWAGELGGAKPSRLVRMCPTTNKSGGPLLDEWSRRGFETDTWWARS